MFIPKNIREPLSNLMEKGYSLGTSLKKLGLTLEQMENYKNTFPKMAEERIGYAKNHSEFKEESAYKMAVKFLELYEKNKKSRKATQ
jgi:hypothetical protein